MDLNDRIEATSDRMVEIINPSLIRYGLYTLAGLTSLLLILEVLCHGIVGTNPIEGACRHYITLQFIKHATTLSFSLTAFLLVGVVVISSEIMYEANILDIGPNEFKLSFRNMADKSKRDALIEITEYENLETGEEKEANSGLASWSIISKPRLLFNGYPVLQAIEESGTLELSGSKYAVRNIQSRDDVEGIEKEYAHRVRGRIDSDENNLDERYYQYTENEVPRIHWLLREGKSELRALERQLRRAVAYSVSSSILGVLILGFPWGAEGIADPWLLTLSFSETLMYIPASYLFTFVFLGMVRTSIGLLEVMAELLDR